MAAARPIYTLLFTAFAVLLVTAFPARVGAQTKTFPLDSLEGLKLHKVRAEPVTYKGRKAIRVTEPPGRADRGEDKLVILTGLEFQHGVIEVDLAGKTREGAGEGARGFIGVAFRVAPDVSKFESFYLRPTNGRAEDQLRRNHSVQYFSYPEFPWFRLRRETPGKYETYVDLVPGEWTKVKIEVRGAKARLYVHGAEQPTLLVNDLKLGETKGAIALWIGVGTDGYFANLRVSQ
ncbi:hypothetical protein MYX75_09065 [Acidobacteria bacterium AH-259-A15]|nr:hypothetical protein [Acidobacteria bacterium AH-259-A15]